MTPEPITLKNRLSPGDCLMMTAALRDLHLAHPGRYLTGVESPCGEVFYHNPYVTRLMEPVRRSCRTLDMQYPLIHASGVTGRHFSEGYRDHLEQQLGIHIPIASMKPELYLSQDEELWPNPVALEHGWTGPYWIINAGVKADYTLKRYPYYQAVVDQLRDRVKFVQVGHTGHDHPLLEGVLDMRGKTTLRQLFRLSYQAEGALCPVSLQMVIMAAFEKPCVVINGGREGVRWQQFGNHRFLAVNGALPCCRLDGCWKSKQDECLDWRKDEGVPRCMQLIRPEDVVRAVDLYYEGGLLARQPLEMFADA